MFLAREDRAASLLFQPGVAPQDVYRRGVEAIPEPQRVGAHAKEDPGTEGSRLGFVQVVAQSGDVAKVGPLGEAVAFTSMATTALSDRSSTRSTSRPALSR